MTFVTVYPGWYAGRATHIHVEVSVNGRSIKVTQIAFPESVTAAVYSSGVSAAGAVDVQHDSAGAASLAHGT